LSAIHNFNVMLEIVNPLLLCSLILDIENIYYLTCACWKMNVVYVYVRNLMCGYYVEALRKRFAVHTLSSASSVAANVRCMDISLEYIYLYRSLYQVKTSGMEN